MNEPMNGASPNAGAPNDGGTPNPTSNTGGDPFKAFVEHQRKALEETGKALDALVPDGFKEHSAEAGREFVKGMKVLVDAALAELERASREIDKNFSRRPAAAAEAPKPASPPNSTGTNKVKVQVD